MWRVMTGGRSRFFTGTPRLGFAATAAVLLILSGLLTLGFTSPAKALPSFARQTGQPCGACHTDFAGLTPYGRRFKMGGYTYRRRRIPHGAVSQFRR